MAFNPFMHERNIYKERPDFKKIAIEYPEFRKYAVPDVRGRIHIDFNNQDALRMLTQILLKKDFKLDVIIPNGFLIPTVPQRLNYLLWIEDLLALLPKKSISVSGIDIGTGPCAIFSLLGAKKNGWNFVSTETSNEAILWAEKNIKANNLESHIRVIQVNKNSILEDILPTNGTSFDFCLCNPPFFENIEEIKRRSSRAKETLATTAKKEEILSEGGEVTFVKNLIRDSLIFKDQVCLYTSMFGRKKSFLQILKELQSIEGISYVKTEFCQGNTIRWGIAWTFLNSVNLQKVQVPKPKKPKKAKPPLLHKVPKTNTKVDSIKKLSNVIKNTFLELEILFKVIKSAENYAELEITADKNTWSYQRRKKREFLKDKECPSTLNSLNSTNAVINETKVITTNSETSKSLTNEADCLPTHNDVQCTIQENVSSNNISLEKLVEKSLNTKSGFLESTQAPKGVEDTQNSTVSISNEDVPLQNSYTAKLSSVSIEYKRNDNSLNLVSQKLKLEEPCLSMTDDTNFDNSDVKESISFKSNAQGSEIKEKDPLCCSGDDKAFSIDYEPMDISNASQFVTICKKRKREDEDSLQSSKPQKLKLELTGKSDSPENRLTLSNISKEEIDVRALGNASFKSKLFKSDAEGSEIKEKEPLCSSGDDKAFLVDYGPIDIPNTSQSVAIYKNRKREDEETLQSSKPQKLKQTGYSDTPENASFNQSKSDSYKFSKKNSTDTHKEKQNAMKFNPSSLLYCILKLRKFEDHILLDMNCPLEANRDSMHQIFQFLKNKLTINS